MSKNSRRLAPSLRSSRVFQVAQHLLDRLVQFTQREEPPVAQPRQDKALDDQHCDLDLGLVARTTDAGRQHGGAVVGGHLLIGPIDAGLVATSCGHPGPQIIADQQLRCATQERKRIDVCADPVGKPFAPTGLRVGVVGGSQHRDEDVRPALLPGHPIEHRDGVAGVVHEQLLAGDMRLAHRCADAAAPVDVQIAEPAIAITIAELSAVFLPQQQQGHASAAKLGVDMVPVGHRPGGRRAGTGGGEQPPLQRGVVDLDRHRPGDPDHRRATQVFRDRGASDANRARDRSHACATHTSAAKLLALSASTIFRLASRPPWLEDHATGHRIVDVGPENPSSGLSAINRNHCPPSVGISGRLASESLSALPRNSQGQHFQGRQNGQDVMRAELQQEQGDCGIDASSWAFMFRKPGARSIPAADLPGPRRATPGQSPVCVPIDSLIFCEKLGSILFALPPMCDRRRNISNGIPLSKPPMS